MTLQDKLWNIEADLECLNESVGQWTKHLAVISSLKDSWKELKAELEKECNLAERKDESNF